MPTRTGGIFGVARLTTTAPFGEVWRTVTDSLGSERAMGGGGEVN